MELIIRAVFEVCIGVTSSPKVTLFKRFQVYWRHLKDFVMAKSIVFFSIVRTSSWIPQS
jgi:hypothetical protein